jgi:hypothetical protein
MHWNEDDGMTYSIMSASYDRAYMDKINAARKVEDAIKEGNRPKTIT